MDLRAPPSSPTASQRAPRLGTVILLQLVTLATIALLLFVALRVRGTAESAGAEHLRELGGKLKAAGAIDEAAAVYQDWLELGAAEPKTRGRVAFGLATLLLEQGRYEKALRWLYEAQAQGGAEQAEVDAKIVHCLERLGRVHAARAALNAASSLPDAVASQRPADDLVVAEIGARKIYRSDVQRALDDLPPELAKQFTSPDQRLAFLRKFVGDELLARKAQKLEYDRDPEVRRRLESIYRQLVASAFIEKEILGKIQPSETDLKNHFAANRDRFAPQGDTTEKGKPEITFERVRRQVEQDYRLNRLQAAYQEQIESEIQTEKVVLYPERLEEKR